MRSQTLIGAALVLLVWGDPALLGASGHGGHDSAPRKVTVRGRTVCLDDSGTPASSLEGCDSGETGFQFALKSAGGEIYRFSSSDSRVTMLTDPRVRASELEVQGWLTPENVLAIVHLYSIHEGRRYEPYYYCPTCNITSHTPGLCWCCRNPFEFHEDPVDPSGKKP